MAAPTIDNAGQSATGTATNQVTLSSFAIGAGEGRMLLVGVSYFDSGLGTFNQTSGVTYGGVSLTMFASNDQVAFASGHQRCEGWYLMNPTVGSANIVVSFNGNADEIVVGADSWFSVDGTNTFSSITKNQDPSATTLPTVTVATTTTNQVIHDIVAGGDSGGAFPVATGTSRWAARNAVSATAGLGQSKTGTGSSVTMNYTTNTVNEYVIIGFAINSNDVDSVVIQNQWRVVVS